MNEAPKQCFKCKKWQDLDCFYKHPQMKDGHLGKCKECAKKDVLEHRIANIERIRDYDKERNQLPHRKQGRKDYAQAHPDIIAKCHKKYRRKYPTKYLAKTLLNNAVRDKRLKKPDKCSECGRKCRIHGHHEDYYKPLEVIWLCQICHIKRHKEVNYDIRSNESSRSDQCQNQEA